VLERQDYLHVPRIVPITPTEVPKEFDDADFSPEAIKTRADEGEAQTEKALKEAGLWARAKSKLKRPMSQPFDASKSLTAVEQDSTIIAVIEMSQSRWLVAAVVPGVKRQPLKRLDADEEALLSRP
jgi:hypothetical protein